MKTIVLAFAISALAAHGALAQANDIRKERVQFAKGASGAAIVGSIKGYETIDYILDARAGQSMNVSMATDNGANYFNILAPGETVVAFFNGSISENQYEGTLPASGDYSIRVYLMRSAARRDEVASYRLEVSITAGDKQSSGDSDAVVAGTDYNATGMVPCAQAKGQPMGQCPFGVIREGSGSATVVVTRPDGRTRAIFFKAGKAVGSDASEADGGPFSTEREADLNTIRVGDERYEIPDVVVLGD